jgi:hypothetical protein
MIGAVLVNCKCVTTGILYTAYSKGPDHVGPIYISRRAG